MLDRYAWEIKEISDAALKLGEEDGLEAEARLLQNSERIMKAVEAHISSLMRRTRFFRVWRVCATSCSMRHATQPSGIACRVCRQRLDQLGRLPHGAERIYGRQ